MKAIIQQISNKPVQILIKYNPITFNVDLKYIKMITYLSESDRAKDSMESVILVQDFTLPKVNELHEDVREKKEASSLPSK